MGVAYERPASAQALAFNVSVPIAQPVYYYDPFYPAAYQTYFGYYYPTYNWLPRAYYASFSAAAIAQTPSTSTYYYGYPSSFGYPYSYAAVGATYGGYSYPYAYNLTYGTSTYYGYGVASPYFTGYYPTSYYGNYFPSYGYYGTGTYGVW
ncbi:MAG: hypothetical protein M3552_09120 [Planctomycetota bacterium]|nr:hypothetical protein [Planctomycetota bacterium]